MFRKIVLPILLAALWRKPDDGYAKAEKLMEEVRAEYEAQKAAASK